MRDGRIKLADFGFCKQFNTKDGTTRSFCGTSEYIAPEIYQHFQYSFPVDYWSLGIMIYEMIVLRTPFYHPNEIEIKNHIINEDFPPLDHIPPDLEFILTGLLKKNPDERFGIDELQSSTYYSSSSYSLDNIEKGYAKCPWKKPVHLFEIFFR